MSHNCDSCDAKSIALPNTPSNTNSTPSSIIPISIDLKFELGATTQISNHVSNISGPQSSITPGTQYERCVHGCKDRLCRIMVNEPNRVQFLPITYSGRSKFAKKIHENFSNILMDGVVNDHLVRCMCKSLIARNKPYERNMKRHLKNQLHSNAVARSGVQSVVVVPIDVPNEKILKMESSPRPLSPNTPISSSNEAIPPPAIMEPPSTQSSHVSQDFLDRKYKLEALLWIEPRLFVFMPAQSIQIPLYKPTAIFREFAIPGFQTDDLVVCTSCVSILNNYPNDLWNVETHRATHLHFENVKSFRGIQVKNFDFNILKRDSD